MQRSAETLIRTGIIYEPLEQAIKRYTHRLDRFPFEFDTIKYGMLDRSESPYLLVVSQHKDLLVNPYIYNTMLTITSYSMQRNEQLAAAFEHQTQMPLTLEVPEDLKKIFKHMDNLFSALEP